MTCRTKHTRVRWGGASLFAIGVLLAAGCASTHAVEGTLLVSPVATAASQPASVPSAMPLPTVGQVLLVILHTNDNWGETEPCG